MLRTLVVLAMGLVLWGGQTSGAVAEEGGPTPFPPPAVLPLPSMGGLPTCC